MDFESKYIDELIDIREEARAEKNWELSDKIREYLDSKSTFIFDTKEGQEVYHTNTMSRNELIKRIQKNKNAEKLFNSWLFSVNASIKN